MLKLKFELDPKNQKEMQALAAFASVLGNVSAAAPLPVKLPPAELAAPKQEAEPVNVEAPKQEAEAPKRKRRTAAEIQAEKDAAKDKGEEPEEGDAEAQDAEEDDAETGTDAGTDAAEYGAKPAKESKPAKKEEGPTLDEIRRAVLDRKDVYLGAMKNKLKVEYGCKTVNELEEKDYAEFYAYVLQLSKKDLEY